MPNPPRQFIRTGVRDKKPGIADVNYPASDLTTPEIIETKDGAKAQDLQAFAVTHPDTELYPNAYLVKQDTTIGDTRDQMVTEVYHTLPGTVLTTITQDQQYSIPTTKTTQPILASTVTEPAATLGKNISFVPVNAVESTKIVEAFDPAVMAAFYIPFISRGTIDLPRTLVSLTAVWDVTTGTGSYNEAGSGATSGADAALSISSTGRGQGSASVLCDLIERYSEPPFGLVDFVDYFFFLPNPVTQAAALAAASTFATAFRGSTTTVLPMPIWRPAAQTIIVKGQKVSLSAEATARSAVSLNASVASQSSSEGEGENQDFGSTVRAITIPPCLHGPMMIQGPLTNTSTAHASASAVITGGGGLPSASATPAALAVAAMGSIFPTTLPGTFPQGIPKTGIYAERIDVEVYAKGYSTVRVRAFDFESITCTQVTLIEFGSLGGANFVTHSEGLAIIIPTQNNGIFALWFNTGTETVPDLSGQGVTTYFQELISPTETTAGIASKLIAQLASGLSPYFALVLGADNTSVVFTSVDKGIQGNAFDFNSQAVVTIIQEGS